MESQEQKQSKVSGCKSKQALVLETTEEPALPENPPATAPVLPVVKVTSTVKKMRPKKDPGRVAAGKRLAEFTRKTRQLASSANTSSGRSSISTDNSCTRSSIPLTQILSVVSIVVSLAGYITREKRQRQRLQ